MAVHALEHDPAAVDPQQPVLDAEPSDTDLLRHELDHSSRLVQHLDREVVQVRVLSAPQPRVLHADGERPVPGVDQFAHTPEGRPDAARPDQRDPNGDDRLGQVVGHLGRHPDVLDMDGGPPVQDDVAEQSGEPVEVLVLDPRAGAEPEHLGGERVLAVDQGVGEVELRRRERVGAVADPGAVEPDGDRALGTVEGHAEPLALSQRTLERERPHVARHRVESLRHLPGHHRLVPVPRVLHVGVLRTAVALQLDVARHGDVVPSRAVEPSRLEPVDRPGRVRGIVELPRPIQALLERTCPGRRLAGVGEPAVVGVRGQAVLRHIGGVGDAADIEMGIELVEIHLIAPVMPSAKLRCRMRKITIVGSEASNTASISTP